MQTYLGAWAAISRLMDEGASWSGHERHCAFLSLPDGTWADVSAVLGLDFEDDGRSVAVTDWDGDGDPDIWFRNRTGPQLRLLRNDLAHGPTLTIRLRQPGANPDAVGAVARLRVGDRTLTRCVTAGDGYLSQASHWLRFGEVAAERGTLEVRWPDGVVEALPLPEMAGRLVVTRGGGVAAAEQRPTTPVAAASWDERIERPRSVLLREPLPLPPSLMRHAYRGKTPDHPVLLSFWAQWCVPCVTELADWATEYETLREAGLTIHALGLDAKEDQMKAALAFNQSVATRFTGRERFRQRPASPVMRTSLSVLLHQLLGRTGDLPLPVSLLTDGSGFIHSVSFGVLAPEDVLDLLHRQEGLALEGAHRRSLYGGRWFYRTPRSLTPLIRAFLEEGLREEAAFYQRFGQLRADASKPKKGDPK